MKVVHVTLRFDAPGGVETNVREVVRRLHASGDDVEVYASDLFDESGWERRSDYRPVVDGVPVRRFPVFKRPFPHFTLPMMVGLVDALAESGADVIHAHSHRYGHVLQSAAVARRLRIPLVVSTHYHPADRRETSIKRGLLRAEDVTFGVLAYRRADALVVESRKEAQLVGEFAPTSRIRVVPPGIDLAAWNDPTGDRDRLPPLPADYVLFVGRIAPNKGLPLLLDAWASLPPTRRPSLVLMGRDWGERTALEARARRLGVADRIVWAGHVDDARSYRAVIRSAQALVLPSEWEAYGLVLLDALAAGTPVVATAVGAVPEVLRDGSAGRLVPYGDPTALAAALRAVRDDPATTRALVEHGREAVGSLDWSVAADRLRALYRELAG